MQRCENQGDLIHTVIRRELDKKKEKTCGKSICFVLAAAEMMLGISIALTIHWSISPRHPVAVGRTGHRKKAEQDYSLKLMNL
jgi:hypothetical protein